MRAILSLLILTLTAILSADAAERKPNIIYILLDDAGYGDLGCYGQTRFATPNIDRLAAEGMKFTDHYSGSTVCAPTRCVLMTGVHTGHALVRGNREIQPEGQAPMPADTVTIPRLLKKAGYSTGAFGKWGMGFPGSESDPTEHFDRFYGYNCQRCAHTYFPTHLWSDREKVPLDGKTYAHDLITDESLEWIEEQGDNPFFAYLAVTIPHAAMHMPEEDVAPFRAQYPEFEDTIGRYAGTEFRNPAAAFVAMMTRVDDDLGRLLDLLDQMEVAEDTLILFTSDNGPHKEGGHQPDFFNSYGPLTGYKRELTEGGIRTFLLARWPGQVAAGSTSDHASAHWDMMPTFCEMAGVEPVENTDGISIVPTLTGKGEQAEHHYLYWEFYERGGRKAARWGDWKAVQYDIMKNANAPIRIYNLTDDIGEKNDLAAEKPELVERAKEIFADAHTPNPNWSWQPNVLHQTEPYKHDFFLKEFRQP